MTVQSEGGSTIEWMPRSPWLLAHGAWDDEGFWSDTAAWVDAEIWTEISTGDRTD